MWFKNLKVYRFTSEFKFDEAQLQQQLESMAFKTCSSQETQTMGWIAPIGRSEQLFHATGNSYAFCLKREQKLLPASVINDELAEKVGQIEAESGSPVPKKAQKDLKEEITMRLLPRAFSKFSVIRGFVSVDKQIVVVDASSDTNAEVFLACLRKCINSLPVVPLAKSPQQHVLTSWLMQDAPEGFEILDEAEFQSSADDGGIVRCKKQDLDADEVLGHVQAGKLVHKLAVAYKERLSCIIAEDLSIKRLKFTDIVLEENQDIDKDNAAAKFDADFLLFTNEVKDFITDIDAAFELTQD
ncbi:MAG: recombination-associated protein RdgC [Glaciecola sp.]